ncbi:very long chain fatty acid elongase F-like [Convolutriloba macropyga]|uniref:very long chain fatty acid elongase F-like n=1 Tax=Convolutriloba macropyga TaxID=536237 RepID=UPI003F51CC83
MASLLAEIQNDYSKYYTKQFPPSEASVFIQRYQMAIMLIGYASLCYWGFSMAKRNAKPIVAEGKWVLRAYNIFQVIFSGYISCLAATTYLKTLVTTGDVCQSMEIDSNSDKWYVERQTYTCYLFYISKLVDIFDTVFIIIRGKWRQLTFLHVFHHTSVIFLGWLAIFYHPCGFYHISIQLNAPMHFFMYFYYFLSSFPNLAPHLWWKKYITTLQLIQFVVGSSMAGFCFLKRLFVGEMSHISLIYSCTVTVYGLTLFWLFTGFYNMAYKGSTKSKEK